MGIPGKEVREVRRMTVEKDDKDKGLGALKESVYSLSVAGKQADGYTKTTKAIAEYVGRVYGNDMKQLVLNGTENIPMEPVYPEGDGTTDKERAIWSKRYDQFMREETKYNDHKAKVFTIVYGQCDKAMKNRIESQGMFASVEANNDVAGMLRLIKDAAYDSNDMKYPPMQAALALKRLMGARHNDKEDLVEYYKRFTSLVEMVERTYGELEPVVLANKSSAVGARKIERDKMLAFMFMDGLDKKVFGYFLKNMSNDYALGNDTYPGDVENALQVLLLYQEGVHKKASGKMKQQIDEERPDLSFAQVSKQEMYKRGLCFKCGKKGHRASECPKKDDDDDQKGEKSKVSWHGQNFQVGEQIPSWMG